MIKLSLTRKERIHCSGQIGRRKEQIVISEEELSTLKRFFQLLINLYTSRDSSLSEILASKRGVYLPELVLVPKRQPGVQMDLNSCELPDEVKTIVKEDTLKKIMYYEKTAYIPGNYVLEMLDISDRDFTRYEIWYCSQYLFNFLLASFTVRKSLTQSVE